jgi:hypothetical protein
MHREDFQYFLFSTYLFSKVDIHPEFLILILKLRELSVLLINIDFSFHQLALTAVLLSYINTCY